MDIFIVHETEMDPKTPVSELGVGSLGAVELRHSLAPRAGAKVSIIDIMSSESLNGLSENVDEIVFFSSFLPSMPVSQR